MALSATKGSVSILALAVSGADFHVRRLEYLPS